MARTAAKILQDSQIIDAKKDNDTIRLWENHRDQALMWRAFALLQIPATCILAALSAYLWSSHSITLNVPERPLPGIYALQQIPDTEFMNAASSYLNLIASYQPAVARRQFQKARELVSGSLLARFDVEMMERELQAIESIQRTQLFFPDPTRTTVERNENGVQVTMIGERLKFVAGREVPMEKTKFVITMSTIPRNEFNPYGISIINVSVEEVKL